ncbi:hypothetical protein C8R45DRAFT_1162689 [Mycena sanguinolenta]|nr:hypothetical protein C8R45DRAFT_1162689 [Mycena sanguinolenta]
MHDLAVFVPPDIAASFVAYLDAQRFVLPPTFSELRTRFTAALANPTPSPPLTFSQPLASLRTSSFAAASPASTLMAQETRTIAPLPQRAQQQWRTRSLPPEDRLKDFDAALRRPPLRLPPPSPMPLSLLECPDEPTPVSSPVLGLSSLGSSPTLRGDYSPIRGSCLSPLRFDSETPSQPRSPRLSTLGKRGAADLDDYGPNDEEEEEEEDEEDEEEEERDEGEGWEEWCRRREAALRGQGHWIGRKIRIPGGGGGGGNAGVGGGNPINLWTPDCPRRGGAARIGSAVDIGHMPCGQPGCSDCEQGEDEDGQESNGGGGQESSGVGGKGGGKARGRLQGRGKNNTQAGGRKRSKKDIDWRLDEDGGPPPTEGAGKMLSQFLSVFGRAHRQDLEDVLAGTGDPSAAPTGPQDMVSLVARIKHQINAIRVHELHLMLNLIQLVLNVDSMRAEAQLQHRPRVTTRQLAKDCGMHENTFTDWITFGQRLMLLCAGGTLYLLPIIAALNLRTKITRQYSEQDILSLASALRRVKHGLWLPMVRRLMVPVFHMRGTTGGYIHSLWLHRNVPVSNSNESRRIDSFGFGDTQMADQVFDSVRTHFPKLHPRSAEWNSGTIPPWKPLEDPERVPLPPVFTITTPLKFEKTTPSLKRKNRNKFTEEQQVIATEAQTAESLDDLQELVDELHEDGKRKTDQYVGINSDILDGNALRLQDANGKLLSFLFTIPDEYKQQLSDAAQHIHACMPGEFVHDDSRREKFSYKSDHHAWYARYGENGTGAPDAHPDNVSKNHGQRVNFEQRYAHRSKEMKDTEEYTILAEAYSDFFQLLQLAEYNELSVFVEHLPLDASSPCYPFGGFVVNLRVCTWAHRDHGDKKICIVVPFGSFTGGELCLYETGFCFDLKLGDVLIFPSCDITHFNLHFTGVRGTLVLHSDRQGDVWAKTYNGWSRHFVTHS